MSSTAARGSRSAVGEPDLEGAARAAVEAAAGAGADQADAWCERSVERSVRVYEGSVESLTEAGSGGIGLRVFTAGRSGYAYGPDLSEQGVAALARSAVEAASVADADEHAGLPESCAAANIGQLASPGLADWTTERTVELALAVEGAARDRNPLITNVTDTVYSDTEARVALANSEGFTAAYGQTYCYTYAHAFAGEGSELMTGLGIGMGRGPEALDPKAIGDEAADRALALRGARRLGSRRCPVVLDPQVSAAFASIVGRTLSAQAVQRGRSLFADREGERIAGSLVSLVDDGLDADGPAAAPFDGEGVPQQRTALIEAGSLSTFLFDSYTARRAGRASTGNAERGSYRAPPTVGATNLVLGTGDAGTEELIEAAGEGFYAMSVSGLHSGVNPISGSFSVGATGRLIEGGELGPPVREVTIASDLASMLLGVEGLGSEARWMPFGGAAKAPAVLIGEMALAGA